MASKVERALRGGIELSPKHGTILKPKPLGEKHPVAGLDIEADSETAIPYVIAISREEGGDIYDLKNWSDVVSALARWSMRGTVNFFYNLQYDFEGLCKFLDFEVWLQLMGGNVVGLEPDGRISEAEKPYMRLRYVPKKAFSLQVGTNSYTYYDAWQYFLTSLQNAVKKNLPHREKMLFDTGESSGERYWNDRAYREKARAYCFNDALLARELSELIVSGANQFVNTKKFYSSASVSEQYFRSIGFRIPSLPKRVMKAFMQTYKGGRFEMTKRGVIEKVTLEDIKSAYPYAMSHMPTLDDSCRVRNVRNDRDYDARFGAYCVDVDIPTEWYLSPLARKVKGTLCFPVGPFRYTWLDIPTLDLLDRLGLDYKIRGGVELHQEEVTYELAEPMRLLYGFKEDKSQPPAKRYASKINMNGLYGKLIQLIDDVIIVPVKTLEELDGIEFSDLIAAYDRWYVRRHTGRFKTGALFAPFYASYVTSSTRAQLFERALEVGERNVVALHTDSIAHTGIPVESGVSLGDWEIEGSFTNCKMGIVKCGFYEVEKEGKRKIRARGIGKADSLIEEYYTVKRRYGMSQALRDKREDLNVIREKIIKNNLNTDRKRLWEEDLTFSKYTEGYCIESDPIGA